MAQRLLSIDIREDVVSGVLVSVGATSAAVVSCGVSVVVDGTYGASVEDLLRHIDYAGEPCRVAFGAENFFYRNLSFPFSDKRKIEKILAIELEENIAVDMDDLLVDSLVTGGRSGSSVVVAAMLERDFVRERLAELAELKLDPEIVAVSGVQAALQLGRVTSQENFILLDAGCRRVTMYAMLQGSMRLVRSVVFDDGSLADFSMDKNSQFVSARRPEKIEGTYRAMGKEIRRTLYALDDVDPDIPFYLTGPLAGIPGSLEMVGDVLGSKVKLCDLIGPAVQVGLGGGLWRADVMTSALALGMRTGKKQAGFNFRKNEFAKRFSYHKYRKLIPQLGIPLVLCLVVAVGYLWNDYSLREKELAAIKKQGEKIFSETLPQVTRIVDPVQQLKVEIREMKKSMLGDVVTQADLRLLDLLAELSVRIPASINVHIVRMVADNNNILLRGLTDNFNSVDSLKKVLEKSEYFSSVTISSANLAAKSSGIRFELKLQLSGG